MESIMSSAESWRKKGVDLWTSHRHEEALKAYNKAIEIDPHNAMALQGKSIVLPLLGRIE